MSSSGPQVDIEAVELRANAAMRGPWHRQGLAVVSPDRWIVSAGWVQEGGVLENETVDFIAAAREDVPALIARVRELEAKVQQTESNRLECPPEWETDKATAEVMTQAYRDAAARVRELEADLESFRALVLEHERRQGEIEAEKRALQAAFRTYGFHSVTCAQLTSDDCVCGFDERKETLAP